MSRGKYALLTLSLLSLALAGTVSAHVHLDSPSGGETVRPGQTMTIVWHPVAQHGTTHWELEYSLNGNAGPWIPIDLNIALGDPTVGSVHTYTWIVPAELSGELRIRVWQMNTGTDYSSTSGDIEIRSLDVDVSGVSVSGGGVQVIDFQGGPVLGAQTYIVLGNFSGTSPGIVYQNQTIPLNQDYYFDQTLLFPNTAPFTNSLGALAGDGSVVVPFTLGAGVLHPSVVGATLNHCAVVVDGGGALLHVSNPMPLQLLN